MAYRIIANLNQGSPRLEIIDADSSSIRLAWEPLDANRSHSDIDEEIRHFFHELMLITVIDDIMAPDP